MNITRSSIARAVEAALAPGVRKATVYLSEDTVVKATRRHRGAKNSRTTELILTLGRPNYEERAFIKTCKKAGEPLPVRKVQLKFFPKR